MIDNPIIFPEDLNFYPKELEGPIHKVSQPHTLLLELLSAESQSNWFLI